MIEGIKIWQTLDEELGAPTEFTRGGCLFIAFWEEESTQVEQIQEEAVKVGHEVRRVDLKEMQEIIPGLSERAQFGLFFPNSGQANPQLTSQAWAWGIERLGGRIYENTLVTGIKVDRDRIVGVETSAGAIGAEQVVNAAGPWSGIVNEMVGVSLPSDPIIIQMLCTLPAPTLTKATFYANVLYCRQAAHGQLHFGGFNGSPKEVRKGTDKPTDSLITGDVALRFAELIPNAARLRVLRTWAGIIDMTPDHTPIVGRMSGPQGYYVNVGYGGMGFSWSPIGGKLMSEVLTTGETSIDATMLDPARFLGYTEEDYEH